MKHLKLLAFVFSFALFAGHLNEDCLMITGRESTNRSTMAFLGAHAAVERGALAAQLSALQAFPQMAVFNALPCMALDCEKVTWVQAIGGVSVRDDVLAGTAIGHDLLVGGTQWAQGLPPVAWLTRLGSRGERVWERRVVDAAQRSTRIQEILPAGWSGLFAVGTLGDAEGADIFVLRLTARGDIAWQRVFQSDAEEGVGAAIGTEEGGLLIAGWRLRAGLRRNDRDVWVIKLTRHGKIDWQYAYGTTDSEFATAALQVPGGGYLIGGNQVPRGTDNDCFLLRLGSNGEILWQKRYHGTGGDYFGAILPRPYGFAVVGATFLNGWNRGNSWVVAIDEEGKVQQSRIFGDFEADWHDETVDAIATPDGGFVAIGTTETLSGQVSDLWLLKFDGEDRVEWQTHYGAADVERGAVAVAAGRDRLIVAGTTGTAFDQDGLVLALDANGMTTGKCDFIGELPLRGAEFNISSPIDVDFEVEPTRAIPLLRCLRVRGTRSEQRFICRPGEGLQD